MARIFWIEAPSTIREGDSFTISIATDSNEGSTIFWRHSGTGLTKQDYVSELQGSSITDANGLISVDIVVNNDELTEGVENLGLEFSLSPDFLELLSIDDSVTPQNDVGLWRIPISDSSRREPGNIIMQGEWQNLSTEIGPYPFNSLFRFTANGRSSFFASVDEVVTGKWPVGPKASPVTVEEWELKQDYWALLGDSNGNNVLDSGDRLLSLFDDGRDGITQEESGIFTLDDNANIALFMKTGDQIGVGTYDAILESLDDYYELKSAAPQSPSSESGGGSLGDSSTSTSTVTTNPPSSPTVETADSNNTGTPIALVPVASSPSRQSPVLGIEPQKIVTTFQLSTPLSVGARQLEIAIVGTVMRDVLTGSDKPEVLSGGKGRDQITGGGGPNAFIFETPGQFGRKNADAITDFNSSNGDILAVSRETFSGLSRIKFVSASSMRETKIAGRTKVNFIYNDKNGILYYDGNGKKNGWGDGGEFVQLLGSPDIGKTDIAIV